MNDNDKLVFENLARMLSRNDVIVQGVAHLVTVRFHGAVHVEYLVSQSDYLNLVTQVRLRYEQ